ncbi:MAG: DUF4239 domain-containing protein [Planctomycetes bacterium]|nr:DUF4239 domain-containing protein [Planctomycetota bacterium]
MDMQTGGLVNCGLFMIGGVAGALVVVAITRLLFKGDVLRDAHGVTGNLLAVTGTLYAVTLGLIVVDAMTRFEQAVDTVQQQSNYLLESFHLANRLSEPARSRVQQRCRDYAVAVVEQEWPAMAAGRTSAEARAAMTSITRALDGFEPISASEQAVFPLLIGQISSLWHHRRERLGTAAFGIPAIEWVALFVGAAATIVFTGLFAVDNSRLHVLLTVMVALMIGLNLYLVSLFGYPFAGDLSLSAATFRHDLAIFDEMLSARPGGAGEPGT